MIIVGKKTEETRAGHDCLIPVKYNIDKFAKETPKHGRESGEILNKFRSTCEEKFTKRQIEDFIIDNSKNGQN